MLQQSGEKCNLFNYAEILQIFRTRKPIAFRRGMKVRLDTK